MSKNPPSEAQLAANRENAKKSTGPRTPEGKERSSLNAWKHGITARRLVLDEECRPAFDTMLASYRTRFQPVDGYESGLVDTLVVIHWHMDRIRYYESGFLELELTRPGTEDMFLVYPEEIRAGIAYKVLADNSNLLPLFNTHLNRLSREYARISRTFLDVRKDLPPVAPSVPDCQPSDEEAPETDVEQTPVENEPIPAAAQARFFAGPMLLKLQETEVENTPASKPLARAA